MPANRADAQALMDALQQGDTASAEMAARRIGPTVAALVRSDPARVLNLFRDKSAPPPVGGGILRQFGAGMMPGVVASADPMTTGQHIARGAGTLAPFIPAIGVGGMAASRAAPLLARLFAGTGGLPLRGLLAGAIGGASGEAARGLVPGDQGVTPQTIGSAGGLGALLGAGGGAYRALRGPRGLAGAGQGGAVAGAPSTPGGAGMPTTTPTTGVPPTLPTRGVTAPTPSAPTPPVGASPQLAQMEASVQEAVEQSKQLQGVFNYQPLEGQGAAASQQRVAQIASETVATPTRTPITATQMRAAKEVDPRLGKLLQMQETLAALQASPGGGGAVAKSLERQIMTVQRSIAQIGIGRTKALPRVRAKAKPAPAQVVVKPATVQLPQRNLSGSGILKPIGAPLQRTQAVKDIDDLSTRLRARRLGAFRRGDIETP